MEFQQLRYVCAIAESGSFSRAAEHCHVAQPSLSQQVSKLEDELGTRLFDRLGRRVRLTDAGRIFLPRARAILHEMEAARSEVDDERKDTKGSISVGVIPTIAPYFMPSRVANFTRKFPEASLKIVEETTPILVEGVRNLSLDLAIMSLPLRHREFETIPLHKERLYAVLPRDHSLRSERRYHSAICERSRSCCCVTVTAFTTSPSPPASGRASIRALHLRAVNSVVFLEWFPPVLASPSCLQWRSTTLRIAPSSALPTSELSVRLWP